MAEKLNFFSQKNSPGERASQAEIQDSTNTPDVDDSLAAESVTQTYLTQALEVLSSKLISSWQSSFNTLRHDIQDLGSKTSHMESKLDECAMAHNDLATHVEEREQK
ncbi:Hypothetical predicted protein [Pelobates cultripes]|uniref:Uncharacterized protein n=1 Tax=Pelobates cultripes TaxID=61616 RepID=A0AAD1VJX0_PELCU|nr:Hypothetical predicted protein [Pelobates cultripes]